MASATATTGPEERHPGAPFKSRTDWETWQAQEKARARARTDAGMGFWRLACVVAVGILIAQGVAYGVGLIAALFKG